MEDLDLDKPSIINSFKIMPKSLKEDLQSSTAVISMPSTVMLEAMYTSMPVALLDYTLSPHYVQAAWPISCKEQILSTINELFNPPIAKLFFQRTALADALQIKESASARMVRLVSKMVEISDRSRSLGKPLRFPHRIIGM